MPEEFIRLQHGYAKNGLSDEVIALFQNIIYSHYRDNKRDFLWRKSHDPYHVLVSEFMLQQTQTSRVEQKFSEFITRFPHFNDLASASFKEVLSAWQGLGYNRRALMLHHLAKKVVHDYKGILPKTKEALITLPGIGEYTAGAICAFAYNMPVTLIETNVRTVFLHFFFRNSRGVRDAELLLLIEKTADRNNSREWYNALMDYGVMLKQSMPNPSRRSKHHATQSRFEGSDRQVRGKILRELTQHELSFDALVTRVDEPQERMKKILSQLAFESLIVQENGVFRIA